MARLQNPMRHHRRYACYPQSTAMLVFIAMTFRCLAFRLFVALPSDVSCIKSSCRRVAVSGTLGQEEGRVLTTVHESLAHGKPSSRRFSRFRSINTQNSYRGRRCLASAETTEGRTCPPSVGRSNPKDRTVGTTRKEPARCRRKMDEIAPPRKEIKTTTQK